MLALLGLRGATSIDVRIQTYARALVMMLSVFWPFGELNAACTVDLDRQYIPPVFYANDQDNRMYVITDYVDARYGGRFTVYNMENCKSIVTGNTGKPEVVSKLLGAGYVEIGQLSADDAGSTFLLPSLRDKFKAVIRDRELAVSKEPMSLDERNLVLLVLKFLAGDYGLDNTLMLRKNAAILEGVRPVDYALIDNTFFANQIKQIFDAIPDDSETYVNGLVYASTLLSIRDRGGNSLPSRIQEVIEAKYGSSYFINRYRRLYEGILTLEASPRSPQNDYKYYVVEYKSAFGSSGSQLGGKWVMMKDRLLRALRSARTFSAYEAAYELGGAIADIKMMQALAESPEQLRIVKNHALMLLADKSQLLTVVSLVNKSGGAFDSQSSAFYIDEGRTTKQKIIYEATLKLTGSNLLKLNSGALHKIKLRFKMLKTYHYLRLAWLLPSGTGTFTETATVDVEAYGKPGASFVTRVDFGEHELSYYDRGVWGGMTKRRLTKEPEVNYEVLEIVEE